MEIDAFASPIVVLLPIRHDRDKCNRYAQFLPVLIGTTMDNLCDACQTHYVCATSLHLYLHARASHAANSSRDASDVYCALCGAHWILEDGRYEFFAVGTAAGLGA